jgi:hypothetical protein
MTLYLTPSSAADAAGVVYESDVATNNGEPSFSHW